MGKCNRGHSHRRAGPLSAGLLLLALLLPLAAPAHAQSQAQAQLAVGFRIAPPYVMPAGVMPGGGNGALQGLEYELATAAMAAGGLALRPVVEPFGRLPEEFRRHRLDAFVPANAAMRLPGCLSDTLLVYQNIAFTLERERLPISEVADLAYYDVMAFQNASRILGPAMRQVRQVNTRYHEVANQMLQVRALFSGRTDVVVADRRIFRFLMHSPEAGVDIAQPLAEHRLFPPSNYAVAFHDAAACAAFNDGLRQIRQDGRFSVITQKWEAALQAAGVAPTSFRRG